MDRPASHALTPDEAKARLRQAARAIGPAVWMREHPWGLLAVALASGFVAGRTPVPPALRLRLVERALAILLATSLQR